MSIAALLVGVCLILFICWLAATYMPDPWKTPVLVIVVLIAIIWLVSLFFPAIFSARIR